MSAGASGKVVRGDAQRRMAVAMSLSIVLSGAFAGPAGVARASAPITNDLRAGTTITTIASPDITLGAGVLSDAAFVLGRVDPQPGATVSFALYGPDDATCAGPPLFQSVNVPYPVTGGPVLSAALAPPLPGTYRWRASYSGDANNLPAAAPCNAPDESVVVRPPLDGASGRSLPPLSPFPIVRVVGRTTARGVRIIRLTVRAEVGTYVVSRCAGGARRCPYRRRVAQVRGPRGRVRTLRVRGFERVFRAGTVLQLYAVDVGATGKFTSFRIRRGRLPVRTDRCVEGLVLRPTRCPD